MSLSECIEKHTYREYRTWMIWLEEQWNEPSRTDYYLMQIAREVATVLMKNSDTVKVGQFKLPFEIKPKLDQNSKPPKPDAKTIATRAKQGWLARLGGNVIRKVKPPQ